MKFYYTTCLICTNNDIYVECVCTSRGKEDKPDSVQPLRYIQNFNIDAHLFRPRNSLEEKASIEYTWWMPTKEFNRDFWYIIAINAADLQIIPEKWQYLWVLSWISNEYYNLRTKEWLHTYKWFVNKQSGKKVEMTPFEDEKYCHVSAVIFCDKYISWSNSDILESMLLVHNPLAKRPISKDLFNDIDQYIPKENKYPTPSLETPIRA